MRNEVEIKFSKRDRKLLEDLAKEVEKFNSNLSNLTINDKRIISGLEPIK